MNSSSTVISTELSPEHEVFAPMQQALVESLTKERDQIRDRIGELRGETASQHKYLENLGCTAYSFQETLTQLNKKLKTINGEVAERRSNICKSETELAEYEHTFSAREAEKEEVLRDIRLLQQELDYAVRVRQDTMLSTSGTKNVMHMIESNNSRSERGNRDLEKKINNLDSDIHFFNVLLRNEREEHLYLESRIETETSLKGEMEREIRGIEQEVKLVQAEIKQISNNLHLQVAERRKRTEVVTSTMRMTQETITNGIETENQIKRYMRDIKQEETKLDEVTILSFSKLHFARYNLLKRIERFELEKERLAVEVKDGEKEASDLAEKQTTVGSAIEAVELALSSLEKERRDVDIAIHAFRERVLLLNSEQSTLSSISQSKLKRYNELVEYDNNREEELVRLMKQLLSFRKDLKYHHSVIQSVEADVAEKESQASEISVNLDSLKKLGVQSSCRLDKLKMELGKEKSLMSELERERTDGTGGSIKSGYSVSLLGKINSAEQLVQAGLLEISECETKWKNEIAKMNDLTESVRRVRQQVTEKEDVLFVYKERLKRKEASLSGLRLEVKRITTEIGVSDKLFNKLVGYLRLVDLKLQSTAEKIQLAEHEKAKGNRYLDEVHRCNRLIDETRTEIEGLVAQIQDLTLSKTELEQKIQTEQTCTETNRLRALMPCNKSALTSEIRQLKKKEQQLVQQRDKLQKSVVALIHKTGRKSNENIRSISTLAPSSTQALASYTISIGECINDFSVTFKEDIWDEETFKLQDKIAQTRVNYSNVDAELQTSTSLEKRYITANGVMREMLNMFKDIQEEENVSFDKEFINWLKNSLSEEDKVCLPEKLDPMARLIHKLKDSLHSLSMISWSNINSCRVQ